MADELDLPISDQELIATASQGGPAAQVAWETLINRHQPMVSNLARRFSPDDKARQEDLCQKVWMKVFKKVGQFDSKAKFSTWLYQVAKTTFLDEKKKRSWDDVEELPSEGLSSGSGGSPLESLDCMSEAWAAFNHKAPECFDILQLYWKVGYTWKEVGEQVGKSATAAKEHGNQCIRKFKPLALEMCGDV